MSCILKTCILKTLNFKGEKRTLKTLKIEKIPFKITESDPIVHGIGSLTPPYTQSRDQIQ